MPSLHPGATRLTAAMSAVVLALGLALAAGAGPAAQAADRPAAATTPSQAQQALARAQALFEGTPAAERSGGAASGPADATLVLRDLSVARDQLTGADRAAADRILARPSSQRKACTPRICVHWTPRDISKKDANKNGRPDYVDKVISNVDGIHRQYVRAGYRAPRSDKGRGGNNKTDVYLKNIGDRYYGYCASDRMSFGSGSHTSSAYCVLDNDYSSREFPNHTPIQNMQVTAAHEYYHAVQFAYDVLEDGWFMEATATWAEDEVYDSVNDNRQYLFSSPLSDPSVPLDQFIGSHQYGDWIFFRYLTEHFETLKGGLPVLLLRFWQSADSAGSGADRYGVQAIQQVLSGKGTSLRDEFASFSAANLFSRTAYDEGTQQSYPQVAPAFHTPLGNGETSSPGGPLDHLTAATLRFSTQGTASGSTLAVSVDLPDKVRGSAAVVTVNGTDDSHSSVLVDLNDNGNGMADVAFGNDVVKSVDVTLVNASTRFRCHKGTNFSCSGNPRDDGLTSSASVEVVAP